MFAVRSLSRRSSKAFFSLASAAAARNHVLLAPATPCHHLLGRRAMSSVRGRSMRSRVEKRMQKESGRTLTEIRRAKTLRKKLMTEEERLIFNLRRAKKKVALLLQKLKKYELPELPPPRHDPELFTPEQFQAFKKIGFRNKNYVPVGVRGVFGGVVQNMHMHWKFHETVQVCCDNFPKEKIKEMASMLARLSGGIVINIHNVKTIIMFRGRNYRQPKNLIPINTLTKRKALFKARFEQALDSQKLNIKKYEQELRRKGVSPEDPVAMASIQRVASTFFNAIDKKDGSPYVFHGNKDPSESTPRFLEHTEPGDDSDQEELDKFIADIEDAADKEWAEEEAAEKEELGRIRYLNREYAGGRYRKFDMDSGEDSGDDDRGGRVMRDRHGRQMSDRRLSNDSEDDGEDDSNTVTNESDLESDVDYSASAPYKSKKLSAGRGGDSNNNIKRRPDLRYVEAEGNLAEEDSGTEDALSDLEDAMWKSDSEQEQGPARPGVGNYEHSSDDEEGDSYKTKHWQTDDETN
uniref:CRM domain-containing protein n=1 Tax=Kalanchoe fedtschenkoi TaxID=63787 RepID=A0A7N0ZRU2_KALFE